MDDSNVNPYQSPRADTYDPPPPAVASQSRRLFRWRVIPVTLLYLYGGSALLVGMGGLGELAFFIAFPRRSMPFHSLFALSSICLAATAVGGVLLYAARVLWQGRWRRAGILFLVGLAAAAGMGPAGMFLRGWLSSLP
jgi:hypothetical protein